MARIQEVKEKDQDKILRDMIIESIQKYRCKTIRDIVDTLKTQYDITITIDRIQRTVEELQGRNEIILSEPKVQGPFLNYFTRGYDRLEFFVIAITVALATITIYLIPSVEAWSTIRIVVGGVFVLFLPGYTSIQLLFPRKELPYTERIALSIGLSLVLNVLLGLILKYTSLEFGLNVIVTSIAILTIALALAASYRQFKHAR